MICRLKNAIFGVISKGLGVKSQALLFNANSGKSFTGDIKTDSTQYEGGNLVFGYGEIRFKNNTNMEFIVNIRAFGNKYFNFKKEDIIGKEEATFLDALEIYRIDHWNTHHYLISSSSIEKDSDCMQCVRINEG